MPLPISPSSSPHPAERTASRSILTWSAWQRLLLVLPAIALLWLAVAWTQRGIAPW